MKRAHLAIVPALFLITGAGATPGAGTVAGVGAPGADLRVDLANLRNAKGMLLLCLSSAPKHFPDCGSDPAARMIRVPAAKAGDLVFKAIAPGDYALSVMHDENGNAKLDTTMGLPREGFGFSRNPVVRFGPPKYAQVRFAMTPAPMRLPIKMKYFL